MLNLKHERSVKRTVIERLNQMLHADDLFTYGLIIIIAFLIPGTLTIMNLRNLCTQTTKAANTLSLATLIVGGIDYLLLLSFSFDPAGEWNEAVFHYQTHYPISSNFSISVELPIILGVTCLLLLLFLKPETLSPIASAAMIAGIFLLNVFQLLMAIQISKQIFETNDPMTLLLHMLFYVYHFNILFISCIAIKKQIKYQLKFFESLPNTSAQSKLTIFLYTYINNIYKYSGLIFVCFFVIIALLEVIFILIGQGADGPVKAFTDTADWTFSKQIPPPPKEHDGHYLCTVAAGGHRKVVKPLRYGIRHGEKIIVNRQLCIANAFEDYIMEKFPKFHKFIRTVYDTYGYPISRHITSPKKADAVYILMKPLEWIFLIFLYVFDVNPEERIRRQYL